MVMIFFMSPCRSHFHIPLDVCLFGFPMILPHSTSVIFAFSYPLLGVLNFFCATISFRSTLPATYTRGTHIFLIHRFASFLHAEFCSTQIHLSAFPVLITSPLRIAIARLKRETYASCILYVLQESCLVSRDVL